MKARDLIAELTPTGHDCEVIFFCDGKRVLFSEAIFTPPMPTDDPYDRTVPVWEIWLKSGGDE